MLGVFNKKISNPEGSNKKYILRFFAGFIAAFPVIFVVLSWIIMEPSDMWRWAIYSEVSNSEKVERAFQNKELASKIKSELDEQIATLNAKIEEQKNTIEKNKIIISSAKQLEQENDNLKKQVLEFNSDLAKLSVELKEQNKKILNNAKRLEQENNNLKQEVSGFKSELVKNEEGISALETKLAKVENQNKTLNKQVKEKDNKINQIEKENNTLNNEIKSAITGKSDSKESEQILTIPLGEIILSKGKPKIMLNGNASFTATHVRTSYCNIKIFSLLGKSENIHFKINDSSPTNFTLANQSYIMHFIGTDGYIGANGHATICKIKILKV